MINRVAVFSRRPIPTLLNTGTTYENFQQSGKQDSLRHLLKSSTMAAAQKAENHGDE